MSNHQARRRGSRGAPLLRWVERVLVIAGTGALLWCTVLVGDAVLAQRMARSALDSAALAEPADLPIVLESPRILPRRPALLTGSPIGALSIPRVRLSAVVLHGADAKTLRRGPGHLESTALPGASGNVVIAGHRDSFFWPLRHIERGDDIFLDTPEGQFHYRVTSLQVVKPHDLSPLARTDEAVLTLITCYPFWVLGEAPDRFVVRALAVAPGPSARAVTAAPQPEPVTMPVTRPAPPREPVAVATVARPDEHLVRQAVERFRLAHNSLLVRRDRAASSLLGAQTCHVAVSDDQATATCEAAGRSSSATGPDVRTFTLDRANGAWAIRQIALR